MKLPLFGALLMALAVGIRGADPLPRPAATNPTGLTNQVAIWCDDGARISTNLVVFRKNVRAADPQMYLECELLTAWLSAKSTNAPKRTADAQSTRTDTSDIDLIIAETNVMIITAEIQVIGDRAVYSATNDVLLVTGQLVVALNAQGSFAGTNIVFNRRTGEISGDGPITTILNGTLSRSNAPPVAPRPK